MMEFIPPELNLFTEPPVQLAVLGESVISFNPLTTLDKCSTIQFQIQSFQDKYIDLNSMFLKLQIQIVKSDGNKFAQSDTNQPTLINNMMHSLFKNVMVEMNGQIVSKVTSRDTFMQLQGFHLDTELVNLMILKQMKVPIKDKSKPAILAFMKCMVN